jgi:hypothetical protein
VDSNNSNVLSSDKIKELLNEAGYTLKDEGDSWRASAKFRGGKNSNSLKIYKNSGVWHDYGSNLHSQPLSKLIDVSKLSGFTKSEVVEVDPSDIPPKIYPEESLRRLIAHHNFYLDKGISLCHLQRLKAGLAMSGKFYQRYTFPIRDQHGRIIGFSGRYLGVEDRPKWKHVGKKRKWVYPFYVKDEMGKFFAQDAILETKEVILVESIGDLLKCHQNGIFNVLVVFGLSASTDLILALLSIGVERVYICYNNDDKKAVNSGLYASIQDFLRLLAYFDQDKVGICLPVKNDFGVMDSDDFKKWSEKKKKFDYLVQRDWICEKAPKLFEEGLHNRRSV